MIAKQGTCPSMIRVLVTIKTLMMTNLHFILRINNSSSTVVRSMEVPIIALNVKPGTSLSMSLIQEQCLKMIHYNLLTATSAYTPSIPFLDTMEPTYTLLMGDEVISTIPARETDEFIKSSVDDLVPIPRESEETSDSVLECNSDSMSRSSETSDLFEELIAEFGLDDSIPTKIDDRYYDSKGDILYFEQFLNEDTSSDVSQALFKTPQSLLTSSTLPILSRFA
ncbi:hypothetical protein Tco_0698960 [Tanacetum coccineum]